MKNRSNNYKKSLISTDSLIAIYQSHQELVAHANQRLYFLFGINSALLLSFFFKYNDIIKINESSQNIHLFFINGLFFLSFFFVGIALFLILWEILPKISSDINKESLIFFATLANANHENFRKLFNDILTDNDQFVEDIVKQIINLSKILRDKYKTTRRIIYLTLLSSVSIGIMLILTTGR